MSTIEKDILNLDVTRFALLLHAYKECSAEVQEIVNEMTEIIVDDQTSADEKSHATDALVEALFPALMSEVREIDEYRNAHPSTSQVCDELDQQEAGFADRLRGQMEKRGMTQEDLAAATGVRQPAISNMLKRRCRPQRRTITRFAEALGIEPEELWPKS